MFKIPQPEPKFQPDLTRYVYEPRVLWSVASVASSVQLGKPLALPKADFKNASKHRVRLTHVLVSPVNYLFRNLGATAPAGGASTTYDGAADIIGKIGVRISNPFSIAWQGPMELNLLGLSPEPAGEPSMVPTGAGPGFDAGISSAVSAALFGVSRWDFEVPFMMPARGRVQFDLSSISQANGVDDNDYAPTTSMMITEAAGDGFGGHGRVRPRAQTMFATTSTSPPTRFFPQVPQPLPLDPFANGASGVQVPWVPSQMFGDTEFRKQNAARGVTRVPVTGFAIAIDQIDYENQIVTVGGDYADLPIASCAQRMICRARTADGGTGEWWWRPGAPIALVCPTLTPALVKELDEPIILEPNESLDVELATPAPTVIDATTYSPIYNVGISLAGHAIVEMG